MTSGYQPHFGYTIKNSMKLARNSAIILGLLPKVLSVYIRTTTSASNSLADLIYTSQSFIKGKKLNHTPLYL